MFDQFANQDIAALLWAGVLTLLMGWSLVIALHEMGHAIPALFLTRREVTIVFAKDGAPFAPVVLQLGRLRLVVSWEFFEWQDNFVMHTNENLKPWQHRLIILGGPLLPVVTAACLFGAAVAWQWHAAWVVVLGALLLMSFISAAINLRDNDVPLQVHDGHFTFNDGYQLRGIGRPARVAQNRFTLAFQNAQSQHAARDFDGALHSAALLVQHNLLWPDLLHILVDANYQTGRYDQSKHYARLMKDLFPQWVQDYYARGSRPAGAAAH
jgi:hypothetical protein